MKRVLSAKIREKGTGVPPAQGFLFTGSNPDFATIETIFRQSPIEEVSMKLKASELPKKALAKISKRQRSYIDEFTFFLFPSGIIQAWYANALLALWDGEGWKDPSFKQASVKA